MKFFRRNKHNWFCRGFWYLLKDDESTDINYIDYGAPYWIEHSWHVWAKNKWSAFWWMVRNNAWNYKLSHQPEEALFIKRDYHNLYVVSDTLHKGDKKVSPMYFAVVRYDNDHNKGKHFSYDLTIRGKSEVYYKVNTSTQLQCKKSEVKYIFTIFGYQVLSEMHSGNNNSRYVYRYKWKFVKFNKQLKNGF